jgi:hypothetical protein
LSICNGRQRPRRASELPLAGRAVVHHELKLVTVLTGYTQCKKSKTQATLSSATAVFN